MKYLPMCILIYLVIGFVIGVIAVRRNYRPATAFHSEWIAPEIGLVFMLLWPILIPITIIYKTFEYLAKRNV